MKNKQIKEHWKGNWDLKSSSVSRCLQGIFLAICVIAVGVGYLGNHVSFLPWTHFTLFFPGWGALFLIVPAIYALLRKPTSLFWYVCLLAGALILASKWVSYPFKNWLGIAVAGLIILIGLRMLLNPLVRRARRRKFKKNMKFVCSENPTVENGSGDYTDYHVEFGSRHIDMTGVDFTSSSLAVSFGEMNFDLRGALVHDCAVIDAECSFGKLAIHLPDYVRAEVIYESAFAEVANAHKVPDDPSAPVVYIHAACNFGEIKIN